MAYEEIFNNIKKDLNDNDVVLYMKGSPDIPQCGFSGTVVQILKRLNISFKGIDILKDNTLREAIKAYANWPTIPQLYIKGEFIGGCDIVRDMYEAGELQEFLKLKNVNSN